MQAGNRVQAKPPKGNTDKAVCFVFCAPDSLSFTAAFHAEIQQLNISPERRCTVTQKPSPAKLCQVKGAGVRLWGEGTLAVKALTQQCHVYRHRHNRMHVFFSTHITFLKQNILHTYQLLRRPGNHIIDSETQHRPRPEMGCVWPEGVRFLHSAQCPDPSVPSGLYGRISSWPSQGEHQRLARLGMVLGLFSFQMIVSWSLVSLDICIWDFVCVVW